MKTIISLNLTSTSANAGASIRRSSLKGATQGISDNRMLLVAAASASAMYADWAVKLHELILKVTPVDIRDLSSQDGCVVSKVHAEAIEKALTRAGYKKSNPEKGLVLFNSGSPDTGLAIEATGKNRFIVQFYMDA